MKKSIFIIISIALLTSCGHLKAKRSINKTTSDNFHGYYKVGNPYEIDGKWYTPKEQPDYDEVGISSWYGDDFHGKKTANGDTYDKNSLTAAHNTLPLPSMVRVTNLENNKTLILMVNDRGPFAKGRVIDVSERAAEILGFRNKGISKVRVQFLKGHTKRLLADLPIDPKPMEKKFSFFDREETEDIYSDDYLETKGDAPLDLMPGITREDVMKPVKKLSDMLASAPMAASKARSGLPKIQINTPKMLSKKPVNNAIEANNSPYDKIEQAAENNVEPIKSQWKNPDNQIEEKSVEVTEDSLPTDEEIQFIDVEKQIMPKQEVAMAAPEVKESVKQDLQHFIQAGTYSMRKNADRVEKKLRALGDVDISGIQHGSKTLYRVRLGPINDMEIAKLALKKVIKLGHADAMLVSAQ